MVTSLLACQKGENGMEDRTWRIFQDQKNVAYVTFCELELSHIPNCVFVKKSRTGTGEHQSPSLWHWTFLSTPPKKYTLAERESSPLSKWESWSTNSVPPEKQRGTCPHTPPPPTLGWARVPKYPSRMEYTELETQLVLEERSQGNKERSLLQHRPGDNTSFIHCSPASRPSMKFTAHSKGNQTYWPMPEA